MAQNGGTSDEQMVSHLRTKLKGGNLRILAFLGPLLLANATLLGALSPCKSGAGAVGKRQFDTAQALLWECVVSDERQSQDAVDLTLTYRALRNYADGMKRVEGALKQMPQNEDLHYISAVLLFRTGRFSESTAELTTAYQMNPSDWRVHQLFALNFIEQKGEKSNSYAEQEFARSLKLNPKNAEAYYQLSRLYYTEQRFSESIAASSRAVTIYPDYAEAYDNLALSYQAIGDLPHAVEAFSKAINLTSQSGNGDAWPYVNYAAFLEDQSPASAIPLLRQAIAIDPENAEAHYRLGRCLNDLGEFDQAQGSFERAIAINPKDDRAYYALAVLLRAKDPSRSAELMKKFQALRLSSPAHEQVGTSSPDSKPRAEM